MIRFALPTLLAAVATTAAAAQLTPAELHGRDLYLHGSDAIKATLDDWATTAPAAALPCASCHGNDGRGRAEGGTTPTDITAASLRRPYRVTTDSGRTHGAYDDRTLERAITKGLDAAGNRLDAVMPRFAMPRRDLDDLLAYLNRLGTIADPGVSDSTLRLGVLLPPRDALPELVAPARNAATAYFNDVNAHGGIFGRRFELAFCAQNGTPAERAAAFAKCIERDHVFAYVASFTDGAERELADVAEERQVPLVSSIATNPRGSIAPAQYSRDLLAGIVEQSAALAGLAARELPAGGTAAVIANDPRLADARDAAIEQLRANGFAPVASPANAQVVLILDAAAAAQMLTSSSKSLLLIPAAFAGNALASDVPVRTFISIPMLPNDQSAEGEATYRRLIPQPKHRAVELATLASASLVIDALSRAGRDLTRDTLLDAIDATSRYRSGFAPQLTFRRDRHVGSTGCHIAMLAPGAPPRSIWADAEP